MIGAMTPPFVFIIFVAARALDTLYSEIVRGIVPLTAVFVVVMFLAILVPDVVFFLPRLMRMPVR